MWYLNKVTPERLEKARRALPQFAGAAVSVTAGSIKMTPFPTITSTFASTSATIGSGAAGLTPINHSTSMTISRVPATGPLLTTAATVVYLQADSEESLGWLYQQADFPPDVIEQLLNYAAIIKPSVALGTSQVTSPEAMEGERVAQAVRSLVSPELQKRYDRIYFSDYSGVFFSPCDPIDFDRVLAPICIKAGVSHENIAGLREINGKMNKVIAGDRPPYCLLYTSDAADE